MFSELLHTHAPHKVKSSTRCGIDIDTDNVDLVKMACGCEDPDCLAGGKVTCPLCLSSLKKVGVN